VDHARALRDADDAHALAADAHLGLRTLRAAIRRHDRAREALEPIDRGGFGERRGVRDELLCGEQHADHARRHRQHERRVDAERLRDGRRGAARRREARATRRGVRTARVHEHGLRAPRRDTLGGDEHGRGLDEAAREDSRRRHRLVGDEQREVEPTALLDPRGERRPAEARDGRRRRSRLEQLGEHGARSLRRRGLRCAGLRRNGLRRRRFRRSGLVHAAHSLPPPPACSAA
jgi:hypothetical protein